MSHGGMSNSLVPLVPTPMSPILLIPTEILQNTKGGNRNE